jgi:hypothetical protein
MSPNSPKTTHEEIAERENLTKQAVGLICQETADLPKLDKSSQAAAEHATDFDRPIYNIWKQQEKTAGSKRIFDLWLACHTQEKIAEAAGCDQKTVANVISGQTADLPNFLKSHPSADHATDFAPPIYNVWKQQENTEAERRACEIRLRAERKAGQLLATMEKATGARGAAGPGRGKTGSHVETPFSGQTLSDMGISKNQSAKWQQHCLSFREIAERIGVDHKTISGWCGEFPNGLENSPPGRSDKNPWGTVQHFDIWGTGAEYCQNCQNSAAHVGTDLSSTLGEQTRTVDGQSARRAFRQKKPWS